jgi:hypothetical protein
MDFRYVSTCFKCIIICRTEYLFLSKQSVMSVRKTAGFLSLNRLFEMVWDSEIWSRDPERQQLWGRGRFWRGNRDVTPATGPTNIQRSRVQQFVSFKCFWWRENFSEWDKSTGPNINRVTVDSALWPSQRLVHAFIGGPKRQRKQWSATYKMKNPVHLAFTCCILWKLWQCWWWRLRDTTTATLTELTTELHTPPPLQRNWDRNACVSCDNNTNGTLHTGQTDRLLGND